jgi:hypothetical protein
MVTRRSIPAVSRRSAINRAEIGSRGADFLSWREYPYQGDTAMIRCAEACLAAWTMIISSIRASLTVSPWLSERQVDCTMNRSAPRIESR